jgi:hypothetical protein
MAQKVPFERIRATNQIRRHSGLYSY